MSIQVNNYSNIKINLGSISVLHIEAGLWLTLEQGCPKSGPQASYGPRYVFIRLAPVVAQCVIFGPQTHIYQSNF